MICKSTFTIRRYLVLVIAVVCLFMLLVACQFSKLLSNESGGSVEWCNQSTHRHIDYQPLSAVNSLHFSLARKMRSQSINIAYLGALSRDGINLGLGWRDRRNLPLEWQLHVIKEAEIRDDRLVLLEEPRELIGHIRITDGGKYVYSNSGVEIHFDVTLLIGMEEYENRIMNVVCEVLEESK